MTPSRLVAAALAAALALAPAQVVAQEALRPMCANGPAPCVVDPGRLQVELAAFVGRGEGEGFEQEVSGADLLFRYGLTPVVELQLGVSPHSRSEDRDLVAGATSTVSGYGDLTFGLRYNLANPDGSGTSVAVQPFVSAPTGQDGVGADAWGGGVIVPIAFDLGGDWALDVIPEVDVVGDPDGDGHHLAYAAEVALSRGFGDLSLGAAVFTLRDQEADLSQASLEISGAWAPAAAPNLQFDAGVVAGLTDDTPDLAVFAVASRRF